jgi:4-amino-4-deoxy-L-arabinose transferase-like glycosyltransferase
VTARGWLLFFTLVSALVLGTLGLRPLYKADESRYAEIPREMVAKGDWITPRLNDFKYFEKPPLQYWATAAFFTAFGEKDATARLWTALTGLAGVFLVMFFGNRVFSPPAGYLAAAVLAGCPLYVLLLQVNTLDMGLTFFLSAAMFAFALGWMHLFWAACALAVLSKGLVGIVLPLAAIGLYILVRWDWALLRRMRILTGSLLFLAIAAPWFIAVSLANEEFAHFFFVQEHFQRFTTRIHGRYQPVWYFLPILAFGLAPWLVLLVPAFLKNLFSKLKSRGAFDARLFLLLWVALLFAFFSVSSSKLPSYVLPMFPPLAVLIGQWIASAQPRRLLTVQAMLAAMAGLAIAIFATQLERFLPPELRPLSAGYLPWLVGAGVALAVSAIAAFLAAWGGRTPRAVMLLAFGGFACTLAAMVGHRALSPGFSIAEQAAAMPRPPPEARIFAVDFYDHTIPWYFGRPVTMVHYKDELGEAIKWQPQKFIPDLEGFARAWAAAPSAYAVFSSQKFDPLRKELGAPLEGVSRGPRYTIVRKP